MKVIEEYSHKGGRAFILEKHRGELQDIYDAIASTNATECLRKVSKEKTKPPLLFHPESFNTSLKQFLCPRGWTEAAPSSKKGFKEPRINLGHGAFREMDGIKNRVGLEIQFGKYAFMGYDIFSKMPIFAKRDLIDCGIEVVATLDVVRQMSTGVSAFNQIVTDMGERGEADLDIPVMVIGIGLTGLEEKKCEEKRTRFLNERDQMIASGEVAKGRKGALPGPKGELFE